MSGGAWLCEHARHRTTLGCAPPGAARLAVPGVFFTACLLLLADCGKRSEPVVADVPVSVTAAGRPGLTDGLKNVLAHLGSGAGPGLGDLARHAVEADPQVRVALAQVSGAEVGVTEARASRYPSLTYDLSGSGQNGDASAQVGISQLLFDHGRTRAMIGSANESAQRQVALFWKAVETAIAKAAMDYIALAQGQAVVAEAQRYLATATELQVKIDSRVAAGAADQSDSVAAQIAVNRAQSEVDRALSQVAVARSNLSLSAGFEPAVVPSLDALRAEIPAAAADGTSATPAVRAAESAVTAAMLDVRAARAANRPPIKLAARSDLANEGEVWVGLELTGSLFSGGGQRAKIRAAEARAVAAQEALQSERQAAAVSSRAADITEAGSALRAGQLTEIADLAKQSADLDWQEYQLDKHPLNSVIESHRQVYSARADLAGALADELRARVRGLEAEGRLYETFLGGASR